jgi:hypothetical protein
MKPGAIWASAGDTSSSTTTSGDASASQRSSGTAEAFDTCTLALASVSVAVEAAASLDGNAGAAVQNGNGSSSAASSHRLSTKNANPSPTSMPNTNSPCQWLARSSSHSALEAVPGRARASSGDKRPRAHITSSVRMRQRQRVARGPWGACKPEAVDGCMGTQLAAGVRKWKVAASSPIRVNPSRS